MTGARIVQDAHRSVEARQIAGVAGQDTSGIASPLFAGPFTGLPVSIFSYARQPGEDFRSLTAAASLVLLVMVLAMNGVSIWLRNRYERKW